MPPRDSRPHELAVTWSRCTLGWVPPPAVQPAQAAPGGPATAGRRPGQGPARLFHEGQGTLAQRGSQALALHTVDCGCDGAHASPANASSQGQTARNQTTDYPPARNERAGPRVDSTLLRMLTRKRISSRRQSAECCESSRLNQNLAASHGASRRPAQIQVAEHMQGGASDRYQSGGHLQKDAKSQSDLLHPPRGRTLRPSHQTFGLSSS